LYKIYVHAKTGRGNHYDEVMALLEEYYPIEIPLISLYFNKNFLEKGTEENML
jgi:hypothetical protein